MELDLNFTPLAPLHVGEVLREEFLNEFKLSAGQLAKACLVPRTRIERIIREECGVTADTALRLAKFFGTSADFWLNLQNRYDVQMAMKDKQDTINKIAPFNAQTA